MIVLFGDSLTEGFKLQEFFNDDRLINKGIYGDNTSGVLERIENNLAGIEAVKVFVLIGTNDFALGRTNEEIITNLLLITKKIKENAKSAEIFITSILPVRNLENRKNDVILKVNELIKKLTEDESVNYFDLHSAMKDSKGELPEEYSEDGLHLTAAGYAVWAKELKKLI